MSNSLRAAAFTAGRAAGARAWRTWLWRCCQGGSQAEAGSRRLGAARPRCRSRPGNERFFRIQFRGISENAGPHSFNQGLRIAVPVLHNTGTSYNAASHKRYVAQHKKGIQATPTGSTLAMSAVDFFVVHRWNDCSSLRPSSSR